jgi:hypothetical protein
MDSGAARTWQTDKAKFLDDPAFMDAFVRIMNGVPGTNKPSNNPQQRMTDLLQMLFGELAEVKDGKGFVHIETLLTALGALAGFSVQMALRETYVKPGKIPENKLFVAIKTTAGETLYLGDHLNEGLFGREPGVLSVYALVAGGAKEAGAKELPDVIDIVKYVTSTHGTDKFGIPRVPAKHMPHARPIELLDKFWSPVRNFMVMSVQEPIQWIFVLAQSAQKVIMDSRNLLDPALAAQLVMETATAMAKIDPARIHNAYFQAS